MEKDLEKSESEALNFDYFLSVEQIESLEIDPNLEKTDPKLQTSMKASVAPEKAEYLLKQGFDLPEEWYSEKEEKLEVHPEYLACVHNAYTFLSFLPPLRSLKEDLKKGDIDGDDAEFVLDGINLWMANRIESESFWREKITFKGKESNVEAYYRKNGKVVNTNQQLTQDEMTAVKELVFNRFQK